MGWERCWRMMLWDPGAWGEPPIQSPCPHQHPMVALATAPCPNHIPGSHRSRLQELCLVEWDSCRKSGTLAGVLMEHCCQELKVNV